jgi:hypothetical protein
MKNLIVFLFLINVLIANTQQLIPNQPSFYVSGSGTLPPVPSQLFDGNLTTPANVSQSFTNCCSYPSPTFTGMTQYCFNWNFQSGFFSSNSDLVIDLQRSAYVKKIKLKSSSMASCVLVPPSIGALPNNWTSYNPSSTSSIGVIARIQSGASQFGPWTNVKDTTFVIGNTDSDISITINKVSRYYKIIFLNVDLFTQYFNGVKPNGSFTYTFNNCSNSVAGLRVREFEFYEDPTLITSSEPIPLINSNCTTLSSVVQGEYYQWSTGETTQSITVCSPGIYSCNVTNTAFVGNQDHTSSYIVSTIGTQDNWPAPNGEVYAIHQKGNALYFGGDFNQVGPVTGSSALIDGTSGLCNISFPRVYGTVNTTISDGAGGWFIGGNFNRVGNYVINNLAHINANNTVDLTFKPEPNAPVFTLLLNGVYLYAGGAFTTVKGLTNNYIVKLNKTNGDPIFWNAFCNNTVRTMALFTDKIIVGGDFSSIGGLTRNRLAAIDTNFVQATTWDPNPNAAVYKVFINGTKLYVGGDFTNIATVAKSRGAGFTLPGFTLDPYDFGANNRIHDFTFFNNVLYAAGNFTVIGGASRNYLAGLNPLNALANSFNASADGIVQTVAIYNGAVIAGGDFSNIGGAARNRLASLIPTTGAVNTWNPNVMGLKGTVYNVMSISSSGSTILAAGTFWGVGPSVRNNIAAIDVTNGTLLPFDANANNIVRSITSDATFLYLGGEFTTLNSTVLKNRIAQVNATSGFPTGWNPNSDGSVNAMTVNSGTLYVGGAFGNIGGAARARLAGLSTTTGAASAFNPTANGNVNALLTSGDSLFIGGAFTTIGGQTRNRIAAYTMSNSTLTAFNPNANNIVNAFAKISSKLYVGGTFTTLGSQTINSLGQIDLTSGLATTFNANLTSSSGINALGVSDSSLYNCGGYQYNSNGQLFSNATVLKTVSQSYGHWTPQPDDIVRSIYVSTNKVFLGGRFKVVQSRYQPYFTTADIFYNGATPIYSSLSSNTICANQSLTINGSNLNSVTSVAIGGINVPFTIISATSLSVNPTTAISGLLTLNFPGGAVNTNQTIIVNTPTSPNFNQVNSICTGNSISPLPLTSINGITGTWSPSLNNTITNTYTFTPNSGQCATNASMTITVDPLTVPTFTQVTPICSGSIINNLPTTSNNGISGSWSPALNNTSTTTYTFTPSSITSPTCATNATMAITVNPNPTATIVAVGSTNICQGGSVTLNANTGSGLTYQWKNNGANISGATSSNYTANAPGFYSVLVTNSNNCSTSSSTTSVTVNPLTVPSFTQVAPICQGGTLNALPTTSNNGILGNWSPALNSTATTTYAFTPTSTAFPACATSATMTIIVNSNPIATITAGGTTSICQGSSVVLNTNTGTGLTYQWLNNGLNILGSTSSSYTANSTGSYTVLVTNVDNCSATSGAISVIVNPSILPTFTQITPICLGSTLNALPTTSSNNISGTWSPAINNLATTTYTFTPNVGQCATTTNMTIQVTQPTTPTFSQVPSICSGETLNALPTISVNNISGVWAPALNNTATTTYSFTPNVGQCASSANMTIQVNQPTAPTFTQVAPICTGVTVSPLPTISTNNISGTWIPSINNTSTTTYTFTPSPAECATIQSMTIVVNPLPQVTLNSFSSLCDSAGSVTLTGGIPTGGIFTGTSVSNNSFNTIVGVGTYPIIYTYTDVNGCTNNATQNLTVINCNNNSLGQLEHSGILLYPNPTIQIINVIVPKLYVDKDFNIVDDFGKIVQTGKIRGEKDVIKLENLASGLYYFKLMETTISFNVIGN